MNPSCTGGALRPDPILVYGAPRSGTTYLREILAAHPEVGLTNENRVFSWLHEVVDVLPHDERFVLGDRSAFVDLLRDELPELLRHYYRSTLPAARWWGDKNPHYASDPAILRTALVLFPGARFVHIHRDPRAVIASLLRKRHPDGSPWITPEDAHVLVVGHVRNALDFHAEVGDGRALRIRYEDLVADDEAVARGLFGWLGIPFVEPVAALCRQQRAERTGFSGPTSDLALAGSKAQAIADWKGRLPAARLRDSLQFLAPLLLELGYEDDASLDALNRSLDGVSRPGSRTKGRGVV